MIILFRQNFLCWILVFFFLFPVFLHAASANNSFTVNQLIGNDSTPPSTPTSLTATPIAQTQIDLSWGASTDDFILSGYQVFRDSTQIATTTLTTYSDTGLVASTTYSYFVRAFDSFFNISSSSNVVATTTLPLIATTTPTTTPSTSSNGNNPRVELLSFAITPSLRSAEVSWKTSRYAQFDLRWGRTSSYELGFVTTNVFRRDNVTSISDLQPGTMYEYQLVAHDRNGDSTVLKEGQFTTLDAPDTTAPANVSNLQAVVIGDNVRLTWVNPSDSDFSYVRIVRSYLFYPNDVRDGYPVYQGGGEMFFDTGALENKNLQHYTVFSYDANGNISSGAIVKVQRNKASVIEVATSSPAFMWDIDFSDIELTQNGVHIESTEVSNNAPVTFRIAYDKLPEHLKAITITLNHPEDTTQTFSFLLRVNKDKTFFEAVVDSLKTVGHYPLTLTVFDYQTEELFSLDGSIDVYQKEQEKNIFGVPLTTNGKTTLPNAFWVSFLLLLFLLLYLIYRAFKDHIFSKDFFLYHPKIKITTSALFFILIGGSCARLLYVTAHIGVVVQGPASASVISSSNSSGNITAVAIGIFAIFVILSVLILFLSKKR